MDTHPNGQPAQTGLKRPERDDSPVYRDIFPDNHLGDILSGLMVFFLSKQEHRIGWARKAACNDTVLHPHPNETVAAHQWGVCAIISIVSVYPKFREELPNFDLGSAMSMAMIHDVAEVMTGDITPVDGISQQEKHRRESAAMEKILGHFPEPIKQVLHQVYNAYEHRNTPESKFVKDCDKLDFMIYAFLLERQGFSGFSEFYPNSTKEGFSTKIAQELATTLTETRNDLLAKGLLYCKKQSVNERQ